MKLIVFSCSDIPQVAEWAIKITSEVIPRAFWGSEDNWEQVMTSQCGLWVRKPFIDSAQTLRPSSRVAALRLFHFITCFKI